MTIRKWYKERGHLIIAVDGRGELSVCNAGNGRFVLSGTDIDLEQIEQRPGESNRDYQSRIDRDTEESFFPGNTDVLDVVRAAIKKVAYSEGEAAELLQNWRKETGL